ncbi:MAG: hypothetical protein AAF543_08865 [Pseudomonadota bacterium]
MSSLAVQEDRIVTVDFSRDPTSSPAPIIEAAAIDKGLRITMNWPDATQVDVAKQLNDLRLRIVPAWEIDDARLTDLQRGLKPWFSGLQAMSREDSTALQLTLEPHIRPSVKSEGGTTTIIDFVRDASALPVPAAGPIGNVFTPKKRPWIDSKTAALSSGNVPPVPKKRPIRATATSSVEEAQPEAVAAVETAPSALTFDWTGPVGAAVFVRAGHLWVVFDQPDVDLLTSMPPPPAVLNEGSFIPAKGGTAIRYRLRQPSNFQVMRTANSQWTIEPVGVQTDLRPLVIERAEDPASLLVPSVSGQTIVRVTDPSVGDRLDVLPLSEAGLGQREGQRFVDLELMPTAQGLAWRTLNDRLTASFDDRGLAFERPGGLSLSTITMAKTVPTKPVILEAMAEKRPETLKASHLPVPRPAVKRARADDRQSEEDDVRDSYFDLAGSGVERHLVNEYRRIRRQAISKAVPEKRDQARLDLARLLLSERFATEARTVLAMIPDDGDDGIIRQKRALNGIVAFLNGQIPEASTLLLDPSLEDDKEIGIWRGALEATNGQWDSAAKHWEAVSDVLDAYPPRLKLSLGLIALRAAIETNDDKMMRRGVRRLASLPLNPLDQARFDEVKALEAERAGDIEKARALLKNVADGTATIARTRAEFQLAVLDLDDTGLDREERDAFDRQLPLWRGHPQEEIMLDKLARRYRDANALREALMTWRRLIHLYPEAAGNDELYLERQKTYVRVLIGENDPGIDLFDVYAIYLDFVDLLPDEPEVREVHRHLARLLEELDLLEEAIDVLQALMAGAADDAERTQLATEIAALMLNVGKAAPALSLLDASEGPGVKQLTALDERRRLTRARALMQLDRPDDALRTLRDLSSREARYLQIEILWRERRWPRLAAVIDAYLDDHDDPSSLTEDDQERVLWLALARQRDGTASLLSELRERFGRMMKEGPYSEAFDVATQNTNRAGNIQALLDATGMQLAELERFRRAAPSAR